MTVEKVSQLPTRTTRKLGYGLVALIVERKEPEEKADGRVAENQ